VAGEGTAQFSAYEKGQEVPVLGLLGNGFPLDKGTGKKALLIGGGIGIPPILQLAKELEADKHIVTGYRDHQLFLHDDLEKYGKVVVATEDGSVGTRGNVIDAIREQSLEAQVIYACGPMPMLRGVKAYAAEKGIPAYISLEERMACGVGACLGCVTKTTKKDHHSQVNNARICTDGPVFLAEDVEI
jgi:dihydroorotate dehydrogenase electron transfer subunit